MNTSRIGLIGIALAAGLTGSLSGPGRSASAASAAALTLGPPLLCVPMQVGETPCGPESGNADPARLARDTVALLDATPDLIAHIEIIRRAGTRAATARGGDGGSDAVLARLTSRAMDADARGDARGPEAWFDAAMLAGVLGQLRHDQKDYSPGAALGVPGYAWITQAIAGVEKRTGEQKGVSAAEMHFAASMLLMDRVGKEESETAKRFRGHVREAYAQVRPATLLASNMEAYYRHFSIDVAPLRAQPAPRADGGR